MSLTDYKKTSTLRLSKGNQDKLDFALEVAQTSEHRFRMGAVIESGGRILGFSPNISRNDPSYVPYKSCSYHAEVAALRRSRGVSLPNRGTVFVARVDARNLPALAKPCADCLGFLWRAGVRKAFWTEAGGYGYQKLN